MTDSLNTTTKYHAIPSSEDQAHQSDVHGVEFGGNDPSIIERVRLEAPTKWTCFLLGCAILLPWNALINGTSFFLSRLAGSPFHATFNSYLSSVYTLTNLVFQLYSTFTSKQSSPSRRIFASVIGAVLLVTSLYISTFVRGTSSTFFLFVMLNAAGSAASSGYMCTAVFAVASLFGVSFLQIVLSGQAAVAVAVSAVQVASSMISLWGSPKSVSVEVMVAEGGDDQAEELAARIFFGVSAISLCVTLAAYTWLTRQPFYRSFTGVLERQIEVGDPAELTGLVADARGGPPIASKSRIYHVLKQNLIFMFSIAYVFLVTLAVFPAITVRVQSVNPDVHPMLFIAIHFLAFNTGDLIGRHLCSIPRLIIWSASKILAMSLLRTLFIPLMLVCNVHRSTTASPASLIINSDLLFMIVMLTMGLTNGYVSTVATLAAASLEHNPRLEGRQEDVDSAATLGGSFIVVGLAAGALSSFAVQAMI